MSDEMSPGGSKIHRHEAQPERAPEISGGDPDLIEAIDAHLDRCFGEDSDRMVFHELASTMIHVDIHQVPPSEEFPFLRLVTSGMAEAPMTVPDGFPETPFAELTLALPPDWPMSQESFADEGVYWPIRLLKALARLPHEYSTFLWYGHTIPNADPSSPYAGDTDLCGALVIPPLLAPDGFGEFSVSATRVVRILGVLPLYEDEMQFKLDKGSDALLDLFDEGGVADLVDPRRPSVATKRRRFFGR